MMRKLSSVAKLLGRNFSSTTWEAPILHERLFWKPIEITKNLALGSFRLVSGYGIDKFSQSKSLFSRDYAYGGLFQRQFCVTREAGEASVTNGCNSSNSAAELAKAPSPATASEELIVKYKSQLKINPRHDFMIVYTCKVCETRSMKMASRESYEKGVVVVRCEGCDNLHLLADRLGWFGEPGSVENFLAARGEEFKKGSMDSLNLTVEDLAGENMSNE